MKLRSKRQIGFRPASEKWYRVYNFTKAAVLILIILPLLVMISGVLLATQGREIFYRGPRLGKDQKVFHIIKFRTLCTSRARELTRDRTLPVDSRIETPLGGLLRETRLDELPQLFNILKGDMNFCGPRPVRAEIAQIERERIPDYDLRFAVKPGLIGPTQAYFGHGASKRLRARMNNRLVTRPVSISAELLLHVQIFMSIMEKLGRKIGGRMFRPIRSASPVRRRDIWLATDSGQRISTVESIGLRRITAPNLPGVAAGERAVLYIRLRSGGLRKARIILSEPEKRGVFNYTAETAFGEFVIERYALGLVVVPPQLGRVRAMDHAANGPKQAYV
ncbi:lipopolysaccharide/colanic/teichoic acid biosynthesis glycosyltransferase [Cereibacter ovatus]|uniref:Lipopolysaccharide/colanic/teichoic acid biosynthesis glycosyltransferase n=1 Tax=Cereibacter ovatus TaxID=439529 RepID=A0A285CVN0_9RHOB|nr:sugar transferase [Cereibacter ovatus]SNX71108.1 lipopolysaccharide/colanic/teichoic acid biosynthesis glycosyltransferase [Cereibacter ovatus]